MRWLAALLLLPGLAWAQDGALVRSGEHPSFTRLVIDAPPPEGWRASLSGRTVDLTLPGLSPPQVASIFERIPRTRILDVEARPAGLTVRMACDCLVQAFALDARALVVDIRDPDSTPATRAADLSPGPADQDPPVPGSDPPEAEAPDGPGAREGTGPEQPDMTALRDRLVEQITRAADQGLLRFSETEGPAPPPLPGEAPPGAQPEPMQPPGPRGPVPQISIRTAFDTRGPGPAPVAEHCRLDPAVDAGSDEARHVQYRSLMSSLYGEFDTLSAETLSLSVRLGLGLGLGSEVRQLLREKGAVLGDAALQDDIARLLDGLPTGGALAALADCPGRAGLWGRLARAERDLSLRHADADLLTLSELGPHHRMRVAEIAARVWLGLDMGATAQGAIDLARRTGLPPPRELELLAARIAMARGQRDAALAMLAHLEGGADLVAFSARLDRIGSALSEGGDVGGQDALDLASIAHMLRGLPEGAQAIRLLARAHAARGDLTHSLALIVETAGRDPDRLDIWRRVAGDLVIATPPREPDYARAVIEHAGFLPAGPLGDPARVAAARGLLELGLPSDAVELAAPAAGRGHREAIVILRLAAGESAAAPAPREVEGPPPADTSRLGLADARRLAAAGEALRLEITEILARDRTVTIADPGETVGN